MTDQPHGPHGGARRDARFGPQGAQDDPQGDFYGDVHGDAYGDAYGEHGDAQGDPRGGAHGGGYGGGQGTFGAWQPVPGGGDYDPDQTMHVSFAAQLPPEPRPGEDPLGAHGPAGDAPDGDAATQWTIPVIRDDAEGDSGEYSVGAFTASWDQAPSPAAPTGSFTAGMFGQGAAAAQAAQAARAEEEAAGRAAPPPAPADQGGTGQWAMPFADTQPAEAAPWSAPAADAAWAPHPGPEHSGEGAGGPERAGSWDQEPAAAGPGTRPAAAEGRADAGNWHDGLAAAEPAAHLGDAEARWGAGGDGPAGDVPAGEDAADDAADESPDRQSSEPGEAEAEAADAAQPRAADEAGAESGPGAGPDAGSDPETGPGFGEGEADPDGGTEADTEAGGPAEDAEPAEPAEPAEQVEPVEPPEPVEQSRSEHPMASYTLRVNGTERPVTDAWLGESLLYVLRERLGLAGAKDGCEQGECGACSVQVDGRLVASCLVPAATAAGSEVRTVEGLTVDGRPSDVQRALAECGAVQCGFCIPGMAMTVHDLLEGNHRPTDLDIRQALSGNLCRCTGYRGVVDAVRRVVEDRGTPEDPEARIPHQVQATPANSPEGQ